VRGDLIDLQRAILKMNLVNPDIDHMSMFLYCIIPMICMKRRLSVQTMVCFRVEHSIRQTTHLLDFLDKI
jgi:hypothetical protein